MHSVYTLHYLAQKAVVGTQIPAQRMVDREREEKRRRFFEEQELKLYNKQRQMRRMQRREQMAKMKAMEERRLMREKNEIRREAEREQRRLVKLQREHQACTCISCFVCGDAQSSECAAIHSDLTIAVLRLHVHACTYWYIHYAWISHLLYPTKLGRDTYIGS